MYRRKVSGEEIFETILAIFIGAPAAILALVMVIGAIIFGIVELVKCIIGLFID